MISYIKYIALKCYPQILYYCQYSSADILLHLHSYYTEGSLTYRPFESEISHPIQKRTLRLPAIKTALGREKRISCRSSNPVCDTSPLVSSNSAESVMCMPPLILSQNEIYKDIGIKKLITQEKRNKHRKRGRLKYNSLK